MKTEKITRKELTDLREKAEKWDNLGKKIEKIYAEDEETGGDLCDIGEAAAMAYGYL